MLLAERLDHGASLTARKTLYGKFDGQSYNVERARRSFLHFRPLQAVPPPGRAQKRAAALPCGAGESLLTFEGYCAGARTGF